MAVSIPQDKGLSKIKQIKTVWSQACYWQIWPVFPDIPCSNVMNSKFTN